RIEGIAGVDRAEDRPAETQDTGDVTRRDDARAVELEQSIVAVFETDTADAAVPRTLHDRTDDGVQTGRVTASGEDADALDGSHGASSVTNRPRASPCYTWGSSTWAASSAGRAPRSQRGGREFEPPAVHHFPSTIQRFPELSRRQSRHRRVFVLAACSAWARSTPPSMFVRWHYFDMGSGGSPEPMLKSSWSHPSASTSPWRSPGWNIRWCQRRSSQ